MMEDGAMAETEEKYSKLTSIALSSLISRRKKQQENYVSDTVCSVSNVSWPLNGQKMDKSKHLMKKGFHATV